MVDPATDRSDAPFVVARPLPVLTYDQAVARDAAISAAKRSRSGGVPEAAPAAYLETSRTIDHLAAQEPCSEHLKRSESRAVRFARRRVSQSITKLDRCAFCGIKMCGDDGLVKVRVSNGVGGLVGLTTCGSVWACSVCSAKVNARRALEIGQAVGAAIEAGDWVVFATLTMRHKRRHGLAMLWAALAYGWHKTTNGKAWVLDVQRFGVVGFVRIVELTWGPINGWHLHVHALIFGTGDMDPAGVDRLFDSMFGRWSRALVRKGLGAPLPAASDFHLVTGENAGTVLGDYLAKLSASAIEDMDATAIGRELTGTQGKVARARHGTQSMWQVLDEYGRTGDLDLRGVWREYEDVSKGKRQMGWTKGLRERYGVSAEKSDEDIAGEELGTADDDLVGITRDGWLSLLRNPELIPAVIDVAERQGQQGLSTWLDAIGIEHRRL